MGASFSCSIDGLNVRNNVTSRRLDNDLPHRTSAIAPVCTKCKCSINDHHSKHNTVRANVSSYDDCDYDDEEEDADEYFR